MTPFDPASGPAVPPPRTLHGLTVRSTSLASGRVAYIDVGHGPPILLLHGAPMTAIGFIRVIRRLAKHHRVIAPDFPGFGGSVAAPSFDGSLSAYSDFVIEFCTRLGLRNVCVYLNDSSGCIGLPALAKIPERIRGIVIADTVPVPLSGKAWLVKLVLRYVVTSWPVRVLNRRLNLLAWLVAHIAPLWRPLPSDVRATMCAQFDTASKRDRILDVFSHMARDDAFMRCAGEAAISLREKPVLVIFGQFDPMRLLGGARHWCRVFPNARRTIIPLEEHFPMLGSGDQVADEVHQWAETLSWSRAR